MKGKYANLEIQGLGVVEKVIEMNELKATQRGVV